MYIIMAGLLPIYTFNDMKCKPCKQVNDSANFSQLFHFLLTTPIIVKFSATRALIAGVLCVGEDIVQSFII